MSLPDINAGTWYLRARLDGSWDVCEPTTGDIVAEVTGDPTTGEATAHGDAAAAAAGAEAVRRFLLQLLPQPGQRLSQQPGDVHLGDADALGDLRLRHGLEEPQRQHGALPLREGGQQGA